MTTEGSRLTVLQSDSLVECVFSRREILESGNQTRDRNGNNRRKGAWHAAFEEWRRKYPSIDKTDDQLYTHYANRKRTLKKNMAKINRYRDETGGGIEEEMERLSADMAKEYGYGDSLLLRMLARSETVTGVGPLSCDSGMAVEEEESELLESMKKKRKSVKQRISEKTGKKKKGKEYMPQREVMEAFRNANAESMRARAARFGIGKATPVEDSSEDSDAFIEESVTRRNFPGKRKQNSSLDLHEEEERYPVVDMMNSSMRMKKGRFENPRQQTQNFQEPSHNIRPIADMDQVQFIRSISEATASSVVAGLTEALRPLLALLPSAAAGFIPRESTQHS